MKHPKFVQIFCCPNGLILALTIYGEVWFWDEKVKRWEAME